MTDVILRTDAAQSVRCDGMEILLHLKCEGLSMQASLRKVQESADQLLGSFQTASINPSSFSIETLEAISSEVSQRHTAQIVIKTSGECDLLKLKMIWQIVSKMPFLVEMKVRFYLVDEESYYQLLHEEALIQAKSQAQKIGKLLNADISLCTTLKFENHKESTPDLQSLSFCQAVDYPEGEYPSFWLQAQAPYITLKTTAETSWSFGSHRCAFLDGKI